MIINKKWEIKKTRTLQRVDEIMNEKSGHDKILIISGEDKELTESFKEELRKKFGADLIIMTAQEAKERGINKMPDTLGAPMPIYAPIEFDMPKIFIDKSNHKWYNQFGKKRGKGKTKRW